MYIKHYKSNKKYTLLGTFMPKFLQGLFPVTQELSPVLLVYLQISWLSILFMKELLFGKACLTSIKFARTQELYSCMRRFLA